MYLINYDFYDLHALFVFFRRDPKRFPNYIPCLQKIVAYIETPAQNNHLCHNNIRNIVKPYYDENDELLSWVLVDNKYTANIAIIKNAHVYDIILSIFFEMIEHYNNSNRFFLLCDVVHNIPLILIDEAKPKKVINNMIKEYRRKYNNLFLKNELNEL